MDVSGSQIFAMGLGQGGTRVLDAVAEFQRSVVSQMLTFARSMGISTLRVDDYFASVALNTNIRDLNILNIPEESRILIGGGKGCGGNPEYCKGVANQNRDLIRNTITVNTLGRGIMPHFCFIVTSLGGGSGCGCSPVAADIIDEVFIQRHVVNPNDFVKIGIGLLPFGYESGRYEENALWGMKNLLPRLDGLIIADNEWFYERIPAHVRGRVGINEIFDQINREILKQIKLLTISGLPISQEQDLVMDSTDLKNTILEAKTSDYGVLCCLGRAEAPVDAEGNARSSLTNLVQMAVLQGTTTQAVYTSARSAALIVAGPTSPKVSELHEAISWLGSQLNDGAGGTVRWGNAVISSYDRFEVVILLAGVEMPRIKELIKRVKMMTGANEPREEQPSYEPPPEEPTNQGEWAEQFQQWSQSQ